MISRYIFIFIALQISPAGAGQPDLTGYVVDWSQAGMITPISDDGMIINIMDHGGNNQGDQSNHEALEKAKQTLAGRWGTIYFPAGKYLFTQSIELVDSLQIKGAGADQTHMIFDLNGENHLITARGEQMEIIPLSESVYQGMSSLPVAEISTFKEGDQIRLSRDDQDLVYSDWAIGSTGQLFRVTGIENEMVILDDSLLLDYPEEKNPVVSRIEPVRYTGISCLSVERLDVTESQTSNIQFHRVENAWVRGVESIQCNFAHMEIAYATHVEVSGSHFHNAFIYGGGGKAYGIVLQFSSALNLVYNNIFSHLRHSVLLQAGPNRNVIAYNFSTDPFWQELLAPAESAGELVLHGNFPYYNLFEGNMVQNAVVDNSHGENGPRNTFFRNRIASYGFFILDNPASNGQNVIGNEITDLTPSRGFFVLNGDDHLVYGNRVKGESVPENTEDINPISLYLTEKPAFFGNLPWPMVGFPIPENEWKIPAQLRYESAVTNTLCDPDEFIITRIKEDLRKAPIMIYPNPTTGKFRIRLPEHQPLPSIIQLFDATGRLLKTFANHESEFDLRELDASGSLYLIRITFDNEIVTIPLLRK